MDIEQISYSDIENTFNVLFEGITTDRGRLQTIKSDLEKQRQLEESIKSVEELRTNSVIPETHTPKRLAVFLLNYYGEQACHGRTITIMQDDPFAGKARHDNVYQFQLKDLYTHEYLLPGNPSTSDLPYDFDLSFEQQITCYDNGNIADTTKSAWDSFNKRYQPPKRTADFKSALWKGGKNTHGVDYTISIDFSGHYVLKDTAGNNKVFVISHPNDWQLSCYEKYMTLLKNLPLLDDYGWDDILL